MPPNFQTFKPGTFKLIRAYPGLETHLETALRRLKSSQDAPIANQQLAPIHLETNEEKCLRRKGYFEKIWVAVRNLVFAPLAPETIPETFQPVSRNAETLALQMKDLREFDLETIKKISLETIQRLISGWERHPDFAKQAFSNAPCLVPPFELTATCGFLHDSQVPKESKS